MQNFEKLIFVLHIAAVCGASGGTNKRELEQPNFEKNVSEGKPKEVILEYDPIIPNDIVQTTQSNYEAGKAIADVVKRAVDILSKMDLTQQGLQSLVQLIVTLVSLYFGPYAQVIVPMLSGIAVVVSKSLT